MNDKQVSQPEKTPFPLKKGYSKKPIHDKPVSSEKPKGKKNGS